MSAAAQLKAQLKAQLEALERDEQGGVSSNPAFAASLAALGALGGPATQAPSLPEAISKEVERQMAALIPQFDKRLADLQSKLVPATSKDNGLIMKLAAMQLLEASLKPGEVAWIQEHIVTGSPGFKEFLGSESIKTVARTAFATYKDFLEGKLK